jgi:hypothetical protein
VTVDELRTVSASDFEWRAELEHLLIGPTDWVVRVSYRRRSTTRSSSCRWVSFLLVPPAGDSFEQVASTVEPALVEHFRKGAGVAGR